VVITLPPDAFRRLAALAEAEERVVEQQASLLLKRLLAGAGREARATHEPPPPADGQGASRASERRREWDGTTPTALPDGGEREVP
jgi:hypothetical protein